MTAGEEKTFTSQLVGGDLVGEDVEVTVTVTRSRSRSSPSSTTSSPRWPPSSTPSTS